MPYSYRTLIRELTLAGIEEHAAEAALLLEHFADVGMVTLLTERDTVYSGDALEKAVKRRLERYPLQYILGEWSFFGCRMTVSEACLIPRPDTEILVEEAIRTLPAGARIADLCTGSGCIAVAVLANRPDVQADALELYPDTLQIAVQNARDNGVEDRFTPLQADLLNGGASVLFSRAPYDAILSNPPYIPTSELAALSPEVHSEPQAALDGGEDGLVFYRAILRDYVPLLKPGGRLLLEIGYDQAQALRELCAAWLPRGDVRVLQDLGGRDRVVAVTLP
jgi:release factor glutamine methyltransferase